MLAHQTRNCGDIGTKLSVRLEKVKWLNELRSQQHTNGRKTGPSIQPDRMQVKVANEKMGTNIRTYTCHLGEGKKRPFIRDKL